MAIEETNEFRKKLTEGDGAIFFLGKKPHTNISNIGSPVIPTTNLDELGFYCFPESFVDDGVLINGETNRKNGVVAAKIKKTAPILMPILDDGALTPEIHSLEGLERLRVRSEIAE